MASDNFLLYPDLMSKRDLVDVLKQRYIQKDRLEFLEKDELIELYNKYVIPLPQRKYRMNRRGREMTKKQILASKKRGLMSADTSDGQPEAKRRSTGKLLTSFEMTSSSGDGDRLKPPPSCIDMNKKTIKLNSKSDTHSMSSTLDKLKINKSNHTTTSSSNNTNTTLKIKLKRSSQDDSSNDVEMKSLATREENEQTKMETETDESSKKHKIKKISWP